MRDESWLQASLIDPRPAARVDRQAVATVAVGHRLGVAASHDDASHPRFGRVELAVSVEILEYESLRTELPRRVDTSGR